jgi:hypothetical protein
MLSQESIGVLEQVWETAWGLPGFITRKDGMISPKKDGMILTIEDLCELNKFVICEV